MKAIHRKLLIPAIIVYLTVLTACAPSDEAVSSQAPEGSPSEQTGHDFEGVEYERALWGNSIPIDVSEPPRLILAHPKIAHGEDAWTSEMLGGPSYMPGGEFIAYDINFEGRSVGRFYSAEASDENGRWYETDKDISWYKNFHICASGEWLVTPRIEAISRPSPCRQGGNTCYRQ